MIPALGRRQDDSKFQIILRYIESQGLAWVTWDVPDDDDDDDENDADADDAPYVSLSSGLSVGPVGRSWSLLHYLTEVCFFLPSVYRCGSSQGWSRRFRFTALKNGVHWSPRLAVFGDMGADNPKALPRLRRDTQQGMFDAVLHVGEAPARVRLADWVPISSGLECAGAGVALKGQG